jgi:hypothetical protein
VKLAVSSPGVSEAFERMAEVGIAFPRLAWFLAESLQVLTQI